MKSCQAKFPLNNVLVAIVATGALHSSFVVAEDKAVERKNVDEKVVVVASRAPKSISDIPATVWYVDNEAIDRGNVPEKV